jgi:hypothetical protein
VTGETPSQFSVGGGMSSKTNVSEAKKNKR